MHFISFLAGNRVLRFPKIVYFIINLFIYIFLFLISHKTPLFYYLIDFLL